MKKSIKIYTCFLILLISSCTSGFDDIENSNNPTTVPPSVLFTGVSRSTFNGLAEAGQQSAQFFVHYNGGALDEITYFFQRNSFAEFDILRNVERMRVETELQNEPSYYLGLAKFFRAYLTVQLTQKVGDIPYSESLGAVEGIVQPKYDKQKDVYIGVLSDLEEANDLIPSSGTVTGDIIFDGSLLKWKKLVNTFRLRVLMSLSLKTLDSDVKVVEQFKQIFDNPAKYPLMENNSDNAVFKYFDVSGARHFWSNSTDARNYRLSTTLGDILKANLDPRLPLFFAVPASPAGLNSSNLSVYKSIDHGVATATSAPLQATTSPLNNRYIGNVTAEPYIQVSYHELQFVLAEAAWRGWIDSNVETHYNNAIAASCKFYGITDSQIANFLAGPVKYNPTIGLRQILTQRWVGYFMNSGYEAYWNHRRTRMRGFDPSNPNTPLGYPAFNIGVVNRNDGKLPNRYQYPLNEAYYNEDNVTRAIQDQFGTDDINGLMWSISGQ